MSEATLHIENFVALGGHGDCNVYRLSAPYEGADHLAIVVYDGDIGWQNKGVEVFPCDEVGYVPVMDTVYRSYLIETHPAVLAQLGYTLVDS